MFFAQDNRCDLYVYTIAAVSKGKRPALMKVLRDTLIVHNAKQGPSHNFK